MAEALPMPCPLDSQPAMDDDVWFAALEMAIFRQWHTARRELVLEQLNQMQLALTPAWQHLRTLQHADVAAVSADTNPAMLAATTSILRWPDRTQAYRFTFGFYIVDGIEDTGVFRPPLSDDN